LRKVYGKMRMCGYLNV